MLTKANPRETTVVRRTGSLEKSKVRIMEIPLNFQIVYSNVPDLENP